MLLKVIVLIMAIFCLIVFQWARVRYFKKKPRSPRTVLSVVGTVFGLGLVGLMFFDLFDHSPGAGVRGGALLFFFASMVLFYLSISAFGALHPAIAGSKVVPEMIVDRGPYKLVRHPIYSSYQLFWLGALFARPSEFTAAGFLIMGFLYIKEARKEEAEMLLSGLSAEYSKYSKQAGMFTPRFRRS